MRFLACLMACSLAGVVDVAAAGSLPATYRSVDANGDGLLSRTELPPASLLKQHFSNYDQNRDGTLDEKELRSAERTVVVRTEAHPMQFGGLHPSHDHPPATKPVGYVNNQRGQ